MGDQDWKPLKVAGKSAAKTAFANRLFYDFVFQRIPFREDKTKLNLDQSLILILLLALLAVFALDRFRVELVAASGLAAGVLLGLVPFNKVFSGLANPAVITVLEILLIVQALQNSHLLDRLSGILSDRFRSPRSLVVAICLIGALLSAFMNNIGAFALMLPVAFSVARSAAIDPRTMIMPLSFSTLLGGLCTVVGTPPNLIVSEALHASTGKPFDFLAFAPTGLAVTAAGLAVLAVWGPRALAFAAPERARDSHRRTVTEVLVSSDGHAPATIPQAEIALGGVVHTIVRSGKRVFPLRPETRLHPGDRLLVEADESLLAEGLSSGTFTSGRSSMRGQGEARIQAVILPNSVIAGSAVGNIIDFSERGIAVLAVSTQSPRVEGGLDDLRLSVGDVLHLAGDHDEIHDAIADAGLVEVAAFNQVAPSSRSVWPFLTFAAGIAVAAFGAAPPEVAYGGVVTCLLLGRALDLRTALAQLNWPIIVLLVAMLPLGGAVAGTGAATTIAHGLLHALPWSSPMVLTLGVLVLAVAITPFVNNATTAVVLAPIAIELADAAGVSPAMLLMAVAIGASSDFLTPFGHHNNTLAYALGPYRFRDFPRLGWPLTITTVLIGSAVSLLVWRMPT
ncbi:SLC13 family permease [uncultured Martelella sp.]|uniref:SLC13 family permease n=1 Tax=uncultured Martelella sp. TaxID=392331 RepID=UPI0029C80BDD|nr:SLC13 family permease [uncultured Martelella sp.]